MKKFETSVNVISEVFDPKKSDASISMFEKFEALLKLPKALREINLNDEQFLSNSVTAKDSPDALFKLLKLFKDYPFLKTLSKKVFLQYNARVQKVSEAILPTIIELKKDKLAFSQLEQGKYPDGDIQIAYFQNEMRKALEEATKHPFESKFS